MDSGVVVAIIGGAFTIVVAIVSLMPHVGRLRRLERVVAVIEKVEEGEYRDVLVGVRNRLIDGYRPKGLSTFKFGLTAVILIVVATASTPFQYASGVTDAAQSWLGLVTALLFFASGVTGIIALVLAGRDMANDLVAIRATLRRRKGERDAAAGESATEPPSRARPSQSRGTTSTRPARSARPQRSERPRSD